MLRNKVIKAGIIGCGAIGSRLAKEIDKNLSKNIRLVALCDIDEQKAKKLISGLKHKPKIVTLNNLIRSCGLIIEAASARISYDVAKKTIDAGKDILVMSVGGLLERSALFKEARSKGARVYIPSGAISGLDAVKAASIAGIRKIILTTYKGAQALEGAPYLKEKGVNLQKIKKERLIFSGSVREAVKGFPANINVAAILSLASGVKSLQVNIVLSPNLKRNIHKVEVEGDFGKVTAISENLPCPDNKKTSYLAVLSAIAVLRQIQNPVKIGN